MESPFFRGHWSNFKPRPRYSPSAREISASAKPSPKVVSIPVHFVGSEKKRSDSALKVQKVFRGFLVRKSLKRIAAIKAEVDEIEKRMSQKETMVLIRKDGKERLRMNETLMSLLFRLDSVKGVDSGVRDCRKTVIRKAIRLQERLDAIVTGGDEQFLEDKETAAECESLGDDDKAVEHTPDLERESAEVDPSQESSADNTNSSEVELDRSLEKEGEEPEIEEDCKSELKNNLAEPGINKRTAEEASGETLKSEDIADNMEAAKVKTEENKESNDTMSESERAYICDKLRKKKMKRATAAQCNR
uniref:BAG domain-containing protein n=1 Tax=Cannabis sativa TaxID=3483 RepID=A0A803PI21_CANSA